MLSFAAVADPTRRRIVEMLAGRERTVGELVESFDLSAPAISQHLKVLRAAGLVVTRTVGQSRIQSLDPTGLKEIEAWLRELRRFWSRRLDLLSSELHGDSRSRLKSSP